MKLNKKIGLIFLIMLITLTYLTPRVICETIIGDSKFPAKEGDSYKWVCTYAHPNLSQYYAIGSYTNVSIEKIYQESLVGRPSALVVNAIRGTYNKVNDTHRVWNEPYWIIYNYSLHYIELANNSIFFIVPIPLNLTMVCEFFKSIGDNCTTTGNDLFIFYDIGGVEEYSYNPGGFLTVLTTTVNGTLYLRYELESDINPDISFGNYYILMSVFTVICVYLIIKKKKSSKNIITNH